MCGMFLVLWFALAVVEGTVVGDPGMKQPPRVLLEGWTMCNRAGVNCTVAPRWADCVAANGTRGQGPNGNLVTDADNESGPPSAGPQSSCDPFTEQKERTLGSICEQAPLPNSSNSSFFWTGMLKSGNFLNTEEGKLCGLWCWPHCDGIDRTYNNKPMNQPIVHHNWSSVDANGHWSGAFYGSWDSEMSPSSSFFALSWAWNDTVGSMVYTNQLRTSAQYPWLMLYFGADAGQGMKGGYPWDGRGQLTTLPQSSLSRPNSSDFFVSFYLNVKSRQPSSSFYFINCASCWKLNGSLCNGDITSDVTRYILMDLQEPGTSTPRCGPSTQHLCPAYHTFFDGSIAFSNDTARFPYDAYLSVGVQHFDSMSNPQEQDFIKLAPSPEWAPYGFPATIQDALVPRMWKLNVGALTARVAMQGTEPPTRLWTTLNVGPEMGLRGGVAESEWDVGAFDVQLAA